MAQPYRNIGSIESSAALASLASGGLAAYMDFDAATSSARFGAKGGAPASIGVKIRTLLAGVAKDALVFGANMSATFGADVTIAAGGLVIAAGSLTAEGISGTTGTFSSTLAVAGAAAFHDGIALQPSAIAARTGTTSVLFANIADPVGSMTAQLGDPNGLFAWYDATGARRAMTLTGDGALVTRGRLTVSVDLPEDNSAIFANTDVNGYGLFAKGGGGGGRYAMQIQDKDANILLTVQNASIIAGAPLVANFGSTIGAMSFLPGMSVNGVGATPTAIFQSAAGISLVYVMVAGFDNATFSFVDIVAFDPVTNVVHTLSQTATFGSPPGRTYSKTSASNTLNVAVASGTANFRTVPQAIF